MDAVLNSTIDFSGLQLLERCSDGNYIAGQNGVAAIYTTGDKKVEFIVSSENILAYVKSAMGYPAYYPVYQTQIEKPLLAVLMDLDGTSVRSEEFWIWIIQKTTASLLDNESFELEDADLPYVSGHSVSEHLEYCVKKYCQDKTVEQARQFYFQHTRYEMEEIVAGRGRKNAFKPTEGLKEFLTELKANNIRIGLVTSGLYEKAWPEILSAFKTLNMGDPADFYDAIITAGFPLQKGTPGTLGELSPKPHPWLYAEVARVGLGISFENRHQVVGLEDSAAGILSVLLAGFAPIGVTGGNIVESGALSLCQNYCDGLSEVKKLIL